MCGVVGGWGWVGGESVCACVVVEGGGGACVRWRLAAQGCCVGVVVNALCLLGRSRLLGLGFRLPLTAAACRSSRLTPHPLTHAPQAAKQRLLIQNAAVQLRDAYGNPAACGGVQVRFRLRHLPGGGGGRGGGGELPELEDSQQGREGGRETDGMGRAFFGNLLLAQGSGAGGGCFSRGGGGCACMCA